MSQSIEIPVPFGIDASSLISRTLPPRLWSPLTYLMFNYVQDISVLVLSQSHYIILCHTFPKSGALSPSFPFSLPFIPSSIRPFPTPFSPLCVVWKSPLNILKRHSLRWLSFVASSSPPHSSVTSSSPWAYQLATSDLLTAEELNDDLAVDAIRPFTSIYAFFLLFQSLPSYCSVNYWPPSIADRHTLHSFPLPVVLLFPWILETLVFHLSCFSFLTFLFWDPPIFLLMCFSTFAIAS